MNKKEVRDNGRCKKCGSTLTYVRLRSRDRVCRTCGHKEKIKSESKENDN